MKIPCSVLLIKVYVRKKPTLFNLANLTPASYCSLQFAASSKSFTNFVLSDSSFSLKLESEPSDFYFFDHVLCQQERCIAPCAQKLLN